MSGGEVEWGTPSSDDLRRVVSCDLVFAVAEPGEVALQVVAADSAGRVLTERFDVATDGAPPVSLEEIRNPQRERIHVIHSAAGRLSVSYRAEIETRPPRSAVITGTHLRAPSGFERQLYMRPSRYCPSDHLIGFAVAEFRLDTDETSRVASITEWIRRRISYVPGSSDVHDSAEHTLLTGMGTCRDFAHLGIALCRATGIPARFAAVYAPGLFPMDFHAVFETLQLGRWTVHDATGLAPRSSLVRIATGRDAADAAFSAVNSGVIDMEFLEVSATVASVLPWENQAEIVELA
ncbi:MAG: transglutaminase family protein [Acidimicrobiales bacterium]|jgi:transglutaminase-like putative cysteine protease